MDKIKFAVIGLGNIGSRHLDVISKESNAKLVTICDINQNKVDMYSKMYNVDSYLDYEKMLQETDAEIVSICTPHGLHAMMSIKCSGHKKNVLVEKPMALNINDCQEMISKAEDNKVKLFVVKQNRYNIPIGITKELIFDKKLGKIYCFQCNVFWNRNVEYYLNSDWRGKKELEGGVLYTQVAHFIDLLIWWFGDLIEAQTYLTRKFQPVEFEDSGSSILEFSSGITGTLNWNTITYNKNFEGSITIIGEKGTIKIGGQYLNKIEFWDVLNCPIPETTGFIDKPNNYGNYQGTSSNHDRVICDVSKRLLGQRVNVVEGNEGIKTIEAIEKIYNSAKKSYD